MKILITGATGFLGSSLLASLKNSNHKCAALLRASSNKDSILKINNKCSLFEFKNYDEISTLIYGYQPDIILHTACCYDRNNASELEIYDANYFFGKELIEASLKTKKEVFFLNAASSMPENLNMYTKSKSMLSEYGKSHGSKENFNFLDICLQFFYGPRDKESSFVMHTIDSCLKNKEPIRLTDGNQKRDFIYIDDVISAYRVIIENIHIIGKYKSIDVGSGISTSIKKFCKLVKALTNSQVELDFGYYKLRKNEPLDCKADLKILKELGWKPSYNIEKGLKSIINTKLSRG